MPPHSFAEHPHLPPSPPAGKAYSEEWWKGLAGLLMGARLVEYKSMAGASFSYSAVVATAAGQALLSSSGQAQKLVLKVGPGGVYLWSVCGGKDGRRGG
jgi:hypothetical protein